VALMSYDGRLCWGFNADYELVPDLEIFKEFILESFAALKEAAGASVAEQDVGSDGEVPLQVVPPTN